MPQHSRRRQRRGQIAKHLLKYADSCALVTCFDISFEMFLPPPATVCRAPCRAIGGGPSAFSCCLPTTFRLHQLRLRVGAPSRSATRPGGARARWPPAAGCCSWPRKTAWPAVYQPHLVLSDLQSPRIAPRLRRRRLAMEPRIVVHADAQIAPRRRNLRGNDSYAHRLAPGFRSRPALKRPGFNAILSVAYPDAFRRHVLSRGLQSWACSTVRRV